MERRTSSDSVEPSRSWAWASAARAVLKSRASARSRSPSTCTVPATADLGQVHVQVADLGGGEPVGLGLVGVEPGGGFLDQPAQLGGADLVGDRGDVGVHERRRRRGQGHGAVGDVAESEGLQVTGLESFPAPSEPVAALDGLGEEAAPGLGGAAQRGGELDDRELRDLGAALATQRQSRLVPGLVPGLDRADQRVAGVHRRPPRGGLHHLAGGVVLDLLLGPGVGQHRGGVVALGRLRRVEVRGHRGVNPAIDHRQPEAWKAPFHKGSRNFLENLLGRARRPRARPAVGERVPSRDGFETVLSTKLDRRWSSGCLRGGGFETVAARPPQPPVGGRVPSRRRTPAPPDRSRTSRGNPIASPPLTLAGAVTPPREPQPAAPRIDSPGEGQKLGRRVAATARPQHRLARFRDGRCATSSTTGGRVPAPAAAISTSSIGDGPAGAFAPTSRRRTRTAGCC